MKFSISRAVSAIALFAAICSHASETDKANISRVYVDTVAPSEQLAYENAALSYNRCLSEHGFRYSWTAWAHETGPTNQYTWVTGPYTWETFDAFGEADAPCEDVWRKLAGPRLQLEASVFLIEMPELSHVAQSTDEKPALLNVLAFTLKSGAEANDAFVAVQAKIAAAAEKSRWPHYFRFSRVRGGGKDSPDYIVTARYKNWADYGAGPPALWKMVEGVYGKAEAAAMRKTMDDAILVTSAHVESYNAKLSYIPSK